MRARPSLVKSAAVAMAFTFGLLAWAAAAPVPAPDRRALPAAPVPGAPPRAAVAPKPVVIGAAGDVACASEPSPSDRPDSCQYDDTADLLDRAHGGPRPRRQPVRDGGLRRVREVLRSDVGQVPRAHVPRSRQPRVHGGSQRRPERLLPVLRRPGAGTRRARLLQLRPPRGMRTGSRRVLARHRAVLGALLRRRRMRAGPGPGRPRPGQPDVPVAPATTSYRIRTPTTRARSRSGTIRCSRSPTGAARRRGPDRCGSCSTRLGPTSC